MKLRERLQEKKANAELLMLIFYILTQLSTICEIYIDYTPLGTASLFVLVADVSIVFPSGLPSRD